MLNFPVHTLEIPSKESKPLNHEAIAAYIALDKLMNDIANLYVKTDFISGEDYNTLHEIVARASMATVVAMNHHEYHTAKAMLEIVHDQRTQYAVPDSSPSDQPNEEESSDNDAN